MSTENKNTPASHGFAQYGLSLPILEALDMLGYHHPTAIQQEVIPLVLAGKNVVARSRTGTGKTAAFAVPLCEMAVWEENSPRALVLEPSRELAVQVSRELFQIGRKKRLKVPAVFGGFPIDKQMQTLKQKSHIVVGTPGRVMDLVRRGSLQLSGITHLVIDEADLMLDMGFLEEVGEIISLLPETLRSPEMTARWEERLGQMEQGAYAPEDFLAGIRDMLRELMGTAPGKQIHFKETLPVGRCPWCGGEVAEMQRGFFCGNQNCKFAIWKNNKWWEMKHKQPTKAIVTALLKDGRAHVRGLYSEKTGKTYDATVVLEDDGQYANFKLEFDQRKGGSR